MLAASGRGRSLWSAAIARPPSHLGRSWRGTGRSTEVEEAAVEEDEEEEGRRRRRRRR